MKTVIIIVVCLLVLWLFVWNISGWWSKRKRRIREYESRYKRIQDFIHDASVTAENYDIIMRMLGRLGQLPYKNREKTIVLTSEFFIKFQSERLARISEEEFSPEETLRR